MQSIVFISNGYPTKNDPSYAFIRPIVSAIADKGVKCFVIAPQSVTKTVRGKKLRAQKWIDRNENGNEITVLQPYIVTFSKLKIGNTVISVALRDKAINKALEQLDFRPDAVYSHFWDCGIPATDFCRKKSIPLFVASGESRIRVFDCYDNDTVKRSMDAISGVICVSTKNLQESMQLGLISESTKTTVLPNGFNPDEFYPVEKNIAREQLGIPDDDVIAAFVGAFSERKGSLRAIEAVESINGVKLLMIGKGEKYRVSEKILFSGVVPHDEIKGYLSAADFFVLPTLAEGCCNAIVEAMACGLPIVSSDGSFNDDILNESNSIRIDPTDISAISEAVASLAADSELRAEMSLASLKAASELTITRRIEKLMRFMGITD